MIKLPLHFEEIITNNLLLQNIHFVQVKQDETDRNENPKNSELANAEETKKFKFLVEEKKKSELFVVDENKKTTGLKLEIN